MLLNILILCFVTYVTAVPVQDNKSALEAWKGEGRIVGGHEADISEYPYLVSLRYFNVQACGASIISENWALTAGHCVYGFMLGAATLRAGSSLQNSGGTVISVSEAIVHELFNSAAYDYDVAVLKPSSAFPIGSATVNVVPLTVAGSAPASGALLHVAGWGTTTPEAIFVPSQLHAVDVPAIPIDVCRENYGSSKITDRMICAGYAEGGKDICMRDSGSPLIDDDGIQVGIASWGEGCAEAGHPGVYTNVAYLRDWISDKTGV